MSYSYQTVLRRENYDFDIYKNRHNSKLTGIIAINRKDYNDTVNVGLINNKTGEISITTEAESKFKPVTIKNLKNVLNPQP